ncbi:MAG: cysteine desulfurase-like protein [Pirellulaceae bacterium]
MNLTTELVDACRRQFPALSRRVGDHPAMFFDGPGGTQTPLRVIEAVSHYLAHTNANHEGRFATSRESDALLHEAHRAMADFLGADDAEEIAFGANMTSLTFALSRSLAQTWREGDEVVVTRLDHDANVSPWVLAARDAGATVRYVEVNRDDCTLDLEDFRGKINDRTVLVAVGCASNASGSINPVKQICRWAREAGALSFLDAVHFAPHARIDVQDFGCDLLACSAYKFFGPHVGVMWGRRSLLEATPAYKVRPATDALPGKWMTGTQNHEGIAGALSAVEYLAALGRDIQADESLDRRTALTAAMTGICGYEGGLIERLLDGLAGIEAIKVWGITDKARLGERLPTVSITHERHTADELAEQLGRRGMFVWSGNYYALQLTETLGLEPQGMCRIGLVHYNTAQEVDALLAVLGELS